MHLLAALNDLPLSLLITSLALISIALPINAAELTPDNFADATSKGLWFVEYFSPSCGHCRQFFPTWKKFVEETEQTTPSVKLRQVNCALYGDFCDTQGVDGYPTLKLYHNSQFVSEFTNERSLPELHAFIKEHMDSISPPAAPKPPSKPVNINGKVLELTDDNFAPHLSEGPMFVKFFAPWCGHCKKLDPIWKKLAGLMQGKLTIAEVNCDEYGSLCTEHNVEGYPTLIYISVGGLRSEYNGGRTLDQLQSFAVKASSDGVRPIQTEELNNLSKENEIMYLLIHSASDTNIVDTINRLGIVLLGSPTIFTSSDPTLLTRFSIPQTNTWALVAFKDHDLTLPSSILFERAATSDEKIRTWLLSHRLPTAIELTQDSFQSVMTAPQAPLVVIAATTSAMKDQVSHHLMEVGKKWRLRTNGSGLTSGREIVFAWMDVDRWGKWLKSMYGIVVEEQRDLSDVAVVIADHKRLVYFDKDTTDSRIKISSKPSLFAAVEAAASKQLAYKHSENAIERLARYLNQKMTSLEQFVITYPLRAVFFLAVIFIVAYMVLKRIIAGSVPADYRKVDRLD